MIRNKKMKEEREKEKKLQSINSAQQDSIQITHESEDSIAIHPLQARGIGEMNQRLSAVITDSLLSSSDRKSP